MLFVVFAMVVVACGDTSDDTADDVVEESSDTTEAAAESEAPATTEAASSSAPDGVFKLAIFQDPATQNLFKWYDTDTDAYSLYQMTGQSVSLFGISYPNYTLIPSMATELVETSTDNGDGTFSYTVPIVEGYEWSDGNPITANDWVFTYNTAKGLPLLGQWAAVWPSNCEVECVTNVEATDDYTVKITFNYDPGLTGWQYGAAVAPALSQAYWEQFATSREDLLAVSGADAPVASAFVYELSLIHI